MIYGYFVPDMYFIFKKKNIFDDIFHVHFCFSIHYCMNIPSLCMQWEGKFIHFNVNQRYNKIITPSHNILWKSILKALYSTFKVKILPEQGQKTLRTGYFLGRGKHWLRYALTYFRKSHRQGLGEQRVAIPDHAEIPNQTVSWHGLPITV